MFENDFFSTPKGQVMAQLARMPFVKAQRLYATLREGDAEKLEALPACIRELLEDHPLVVIFAIFETLSLRTAPEPSVELAQLCGVSFRCQGPINIFDGQTAIEMSGDRRYTAVGYGPPVSPLAPGWDCHKNNGGIRFILLP